MNDADWLVGRRRALLLGAMGAAATVVAPRAQGERLSLRVASHSLPPYVVAQRGRPPVGALRDVLDTTLGPQLGVRFDWLPVMSALRVHRSLLDGSADLAPLLTLSMAGVRELQFAEQASLYMESYVALRPGHPLLQRVRVQAEELRGLRVGTALGLVLPPDLDGLPIHWDVVSANEAERAILTRVASGQLDAGYFSNPDSPRWSATQLGLALHLRPLEVARRALFPAFARHVPAALVAQYGAAAARHFSGAAWRKTLAAWLARAGLEPS